MSSRVFQLPETELFFVKTHIIHALAETTSEAYNVHSTTIIATQLTHHSNICHSISIIDFGIP